MKKAANFNQDVEKDLQQGLLEDEELSGATGGSMFANYVSSRVSSCGGSRATEKMR